MVDGLRARVLATLLPQHCLLCASPAGTLALCADCRTALPYNSCACPRCAEPQSHAATCPACLEKPLAFDRAWTLLTLHEPARSGILKLKYAASFLHAEVFAQLMADALLQRPQPLPDLLIPVPLHWRRLARRGYNQSTEVARRLSRKLGIEMQQNVVARTRATPDQIGQHAPSRQRNVRGAFHIQRSLQGLHVALLDDVITTGATMNELAQGCRKAGATRIEAWAVARTP